MVKDRFNFDANTIPEARGYILARAKQLLRFGYKLTSIIEEEWGISAYFDYRGEVLQSLYILTDYRGKGIYPTKVTNKILTSEECNITSYLVRNKIPYTEITIGFREYNFVSNIYGVQKSKRSGIYYMNHVDEGLYILNKLKARRITMAAYTMHPMLQSDESLLTNFHLFENMDSLVMVLATEYRSVANEYLSSRSITDISEIRLSPLEEVNQMLIADKIQNRKDFELYHKGTHPRSEELTLYFDNWMKRLDISEEFYQECVEYCTDFALE